MKLLQPDFEMVNRFLDVLTGSTEEPVTFQTFDDKKKNPNLAKVLHLLRNQTSLNNLMIAQKRGCGIYVMVNKGNGKGRKAENITDVRALFIDQDGSPWEPAANMLKPHIKVESSPGRFHLYWLVSDCSLEQFKPLQQAIAKKFDGDKSCVDLCRVLRVPGFFHLKKAPVMTQLLEVNEHGRYTTQQIIDGLELGLDEPVAVISSLQKQQTPAQSLENPDYKYTDPKSGEVVNLTSWAAKNPLFDIVSAISPKFTSGKIREGKQHIYCPFSNEHTDTGADLSTFVTNACLPKHQAFEVHCMHSHCVGRDRLEFLRAMLEKGMLSSEILQAPTLPEKRPPKIYFPASEIASELQLKALLPNEFRIFLHLLHLSFIEDGTLPDDDWLLSRNLGLSETEWLEYREALSRTRWLTVEAGRLLNPIARREFINASSAYNSHRLKSQKGGKASTA